MTVTVRYWAGARAAAGLAEESFAVTGPVTLTWLLDQVRDRHADRPRLGEVLAVCSVLVGERPLGARAPERVTVEAGEVVELLPPFAGG